MVKIAMIGAGSVIFCKDLIQDIMTFPALNDAHIALMDIDEGRLDLVYTVMQKAKQQQGLACTFSRHPDCVSAVDSADFVISMIQVGGLEPYFQDIEIPLKYGIDQCVGDTLGPGGLFRGLRHVAALVDILRSVERHSSRDAFFINYSNPMAICTWAISKMFPGVASIGLCHGVQHTMQMICDWIGVPSDESNYYTAGINHMAWFLTLSHKGADLYPRIWDKLAAEGQKLAEHFRFEMMKATGFFMTESSGHLSEYLPYFRTREDLLLRFGGPGFRGERGAYLKLCLFLHDINTSLMNYWASGALPVEFSKVRSVEFAAPLMNAKVTGKPIRIAGNVPNHGLIENLPYGCCVEVPVFVDHMGMHPAYVGRLPDQCAALCRSNIAVQELAVKAALEGDREAAFHACLVDPLTAAALAPHEIRNMVDELFAAQEKWLPQFQGHTNPAKGHTIGRQATSDYVIERGKAMLAKWDPHTFNTDNLQEYL